MYIYIHTRHHRLTALAERDDAAAVPTEAVSTVLAKLRAENVTLGRVLSRAELLRRVNPEQTKGLPSFLPLYIGMRVLLASKDCVT